MTEILSEARLKGIRKLLVSLDGQDPEAQQTLNDFMKFKNNIERTNLPNREDVHFIAWLDFVGKSYFPNNDDNPFSQLADSAAIAFMAKGGLKSEQFVRLMQKGFDLTALQTIGTPQERSLTDRILRRKAEE